MDGKTLAEWLEWIESRHPAEIELGLERVATVAQRLGLLTSTVNRTVVTVAGTNGKGSCVAALNALLSAAGLSVGCYTSPHFLRYNERVLIDNAPVSDQALVTAFRCIEQARQDIPLTYFEYGTLAALYCFREAAVDVLLLEVGLGGRLDAVNIIDADYAVLTSVDLDHQDWLGDTREAIGFEKAGVFRAHRPAICADPNPPDSVLDHARSIGSPLYLTGEHFSLQMDEQGRGVWSGSRSGRGQGGQQLSTKAEAITIPLVCQGLPEASVAAALQVTALMQLDLNIDINAECLASLQLPGRFQAISLQGKQLLLDVAHNPAAARLLCQRLQNRAGNGMNGKRVALLAMMADKDVAATVLALKDCFDSWALAGLPENPRAMAVDELAAVLAAHKIAPLARYDNVKQALTHVLSTLNSEDELVVLGSFFTVAEVLAYCQE